MRILPRPILWIFLLLNAIVQGLLCLRWASDHGFWGGIWFWLKSSQIDAVYAAAVIDFIMTIALVGLILLKQFPAHLRKGAPFFGWCALYLVWPSLGILVYLLWIDRAPQQALS
jgi:hypothetical protein